MSAPPPRNLIPSTGWRRAFATLATTAFAGWLVSTADVPRADESPEPSAMLRPSAEEARVRAGLLHEAMHATLHAVHHDFYKEDQGLPIPAATLAGVFRHLEEEQQVQLRWLAVEGQAMNVDHKPRTEFERAAAEAIKAGRPAHEETNEGFYRRAAPIVLTSECLKCHVPDRKNTEDRKAGLVVSIPVRP